MSAKANQASNVSTGKPKIGGAIFCAPLGTKLPTTADGELDAAFVNMGYASDSGLTNSNSPETGDIKEWGGQSVLTYQESKTDTFQFTLIEAKDADVLKAVYGKDNVSGTLQEGITVHVNSVEPEAHSWVFDMILRNGALKRIVVPSAAITSLGDVTYVANGAIGYEVTITATPDETGSTHHEYIKEAA